jgi:hypothetical protein
MEKDMVIFSQKLAGWLMFNSCKLKKMTKSKKDQSKFVYFFDNIEVVKDIVTQYQQTNINGGN